MTDALSIALSGLNAQQQRLATTASNIANASTSGPVPHDVPSAPAGSSSMSTVYKPLQVNLSSVDGGGVVARVSEKENGVSLAYDPSSKDANSDGYIAVPNVDLTEEAVNLTETKLLFKANAAVIKTQDEMSDALLDVIA